MRRAHAADAGAIAALHIASWRSAYRGIFTDAYLDDEIESERLALWRGRFAPNARADLRVGLMERDGALDGFWCVFLDGDPAHGALLDNLHVRPALKGRGLGRVLIADAAAAVAVERPGSALYLWCYEANTPTRAFYDALGGEIVERVIKSDLGGVSAPTLRYLWRDAAVLSTGAKASGDF
jgi:GNAT superfamily N-acetyltransferase